MRLFARGPYDVCSFGRDVQHVGGGWSAITIVRCRLAGYPLTLLVYAGARHDANPDLQGVL